MKRLIDFNWPMLLAALAWAFVALYAVGILYVRASADSPKWRATCQTAPTVARDGETWRVSCPAGKIQYAGPPLFDAKTQIVTLPPCYGDPCQEPTATATVKPTQTPEPEPYP